MSGGVDARAGLGEDRLELGRLDERHHRAALAEAAEVLRALGVEQHLEHRDDDEGVAGRRRLGDRAVECSLGSVGVVEPDHDRSGHGESIAVPARLRRHCHRNRAGNESEC